jgi:hypothetical protein
VLRANIRQHFALKRHLLRASLFRKQLAARFVAWREITEVTRMYGHPHFCNLDL